MDEVTRKQLDDIQSMDDPTRNEAFFALIEATNTPVDWAYEAWDKLVKLLPVKNSHIRSIAAQLLANLAKSDPEKRILRDFDALYDVTKDDRFVPARHCLQTIWKVGASGEEQKRLLVDTLVQRFKECTSEKHPTLIRFEIIQGLRNLYDVVQDEEIKQTALALIETEEDPKYRKKYTGVWKKK